ncbi:MAG TPA: ATP-dependent helicase [Candidatus Methylomirabilis sp.]|nr:ATP-dependent helicase [Candidatus Methylomirabilis sp.]
MSKTFILQGAEPKRPTKIDYAKELNQEQLSVVLNGDGACLVLAGAGSGKTRTITYRVAYLLEQGVDPSSILLLTFTNKAAREMQERVERLLGASAHGIWGGTFHSVANRFLRTYAPRLGYTAGFTILDMDDARDLVKACLKDMHIDPKERRFPSPAVCQDVISFSRNVMGSTLQTLEVKHPNFVPLEPELVELARRYEERKRLSNAMDFDDLLVNLLAILEDPVIGNQISSQFGYVLVDEYQDTNAMQARLVNRFASAHGNIVVVGDDAQSIYAFRGADVQNILAFPDEYTKARVFKLLTNYRSTPEILAVANDSLSHNVDQYEKELVGVRPCGEKPSLIPCASARQEAQYVAEQVLMLREQGTALGNIAVLFRASSQSQQLELELLKRDVPYEYRGGLKFFERAHIKDLVAFLRIQINPHDEPAWLRVLALQSGIGATTAAALAREAQRFPALPAVLDADHASSLSSKAMTGWREFCDIARGMINEAPNPAAMIRAIADSRYQEMLEREYPNWRERLEDVEQFAVFAEQYEDLSRFLADVSLYDDVLAKREAPGRTDDEKMVLSTVHQSKGLEWDTVFIIYLADGSFPNRRAMAEEGGLEEERRLFYVAATRARRRLFLSYPLTMGYDTLVLNRPSVFIEELDPRLLDRIELVDAPRRTIAGREHSWSWDGDAFRDDPTIELDANGERRSLPRRLAGRADATPTTSVWKTSSVPKKEPPTSFLRSIDEL